MRHKIGLLETMLFRCFLICCPYEKFEEAIVKLKEVFNQNFYPEKFADRYINFFFLYIFFFSFYHNKIHPATNYNAIKNKINKTR